MHIQSVARSNRTLAPAVVVIEGDRVVSVGSSVPEGAAVVDLSDATWWTPRSASARASSAA